MEQLELSPSCRREVMQVQSLWESVWQQLLKLSTHTPQDPAMLPLGTNLREMSASLTKDTY